MTQRINRFRLTSGLVAIALLASCSSDVEIGELEVTVAEGGRLLTDEISIVVPAGAVMADRAFVVHSEETELEGAVSRLFRIAPSDIVTTKPFSVSVPITGVQGAPVQIGLVGLEGQLVAFYPAVIDPISGEARAEVPHLGQFVVLAPTLTQNVPGADAEASLPSAGLGFQPGDFSPNPTPNPALNTDATRANDFSLVGNWQGTGEYAGLSMTFEEDRFTIFQGQGVVRKGPYQASNGLIELVDAEGAIESGTYQIQELGDRLVLNLQNDQLVWLKIDAETAAPTVATTPGESPTVDSTPSSQEPSQEPSQQTAQSADAPKPRKGFFGRMGSGLKNIGGRAVQGVKSVGKGIGNQFKRDAEQTADQVAQQANPDAVAAQIEGEANQRVDNAVNSLTGEVSVPQTSGHPVFQTPLAGVTPSLAGGDPCLVNRSSLEQILGFKLNEPRVFRADEKSSSQSSSCEYLSSGLDGSISIDFHKRQYGHVVPKTWQRELKNYPDKYRRLSGMGDDARWFFIDSVPPRLEVEILLGNSVLSVERKAGVSYASTLTTQDAPKIIEVAKLALARIGQ